MPSLAHRALVFVIAFALVASAAAWRQCTALQLAATAAHVEHGSHMAAGAGQHDHGAVQHQRAANEPAAPPADDHGCMKCCSMCTVATVVPPAADGAAILAVSSVAFFGVPESRSETTIAVDPGIPKSIA